MTRLNRDPKKGPVSYCVPVLRHNKPMEFEMEYQQNPYLPEGNIFKWANANLFNKDTINAMVQGFFKQYNSVKKIAIMDATLGESKDSDLNCLYVMGLYRKCFFLIDAWVGHWTVEERINIVRNMNLRHGGVPLYVESDYSQIHVYKDLKKALPELKIREFISKGKGMAYQSLYDGEKKAAKKGKIHSAVGVPWSDGSVYIPDNLPGLEELQQEIVTFPNCSYFDCIDTLAMGMIVLREHMPSSMPRRSNRSYQTRGLGKQYL